MNKGCKVEGCEAEHGAKGYCRKHYEHFGRSLTPAQRVKIWRANNPEKRKAQKMRSHWKNRDSKLRKMKDWTMKNQDKIRAKRKEDYKNETKNTPEYRYKHLNSKRARRGLPLEFSLDEFREWHNSRPYTCEYCRDNLDGAGYQIDRVDSSKGYTLDNKVNCCKFCHYDKTNLSLEDFKKHIQKIYRRFFGQEELRSSF
jgi:hypothetical protein